MALFCAARFRDWDKILSQVVTDLLEWWQKRDRSFRPASFSPAGAMSQGIAGLRSRCFEA